MPSRSQNDSRNLLQRRGVLLQPLNLSSSVSNFVFQAPSQTFVQMSNAALGVGKNAQQSEDRFSQNYNRGSHFNFDTTHIPQSTVNGPRRMNFIPVGPTSIFQPRLPEAMFHSSLPGLSNVYTNYPSAGHEFHMSRFEFV